MRLTKRLSHTIAVCLLLVFATELTLSIRRQSLSWDEGAHIFAGYEGWKKADFGINPEHPPLVKALATFPLLFMHLQQPAPRHETFFKDRAYFGGRELIYGNGGLREATRIIFRARMAAASLSLVMALLVYLVASEIFGLAAGLFALAIIVFEPNLIAHGAYVTTDMAITCFMFATVLALFRYRERPTKLRLLIIGIATGLALASKHSAVLLLPIGVALLVFEVAFPSAQETRFSILRSYGKAFGAALVVGVIILWAAYGFRFSALPNGGHMTPSLAEYIQPLHSVERNAYLMLEKFHALPESYLFGLGDIRIQSMPGTSFPTYIFGQVHAHGVAYYFPAAFVIKSTLGFLLLTAIALFAVATKKTRGRRRIAFLLIPPAIYLLIALGTGLNIGARHILPMYPFLAVLIAGAAVSLARTHRAWMCAVLLLSGWHIVSATRSYPVYMAYSNELWGGPSQTYRYLTDSNVDWGQQLFQVKRYLDSNGIKDCWFGYFVQPSIDYHAYGIPCRQLPTANSIWTHQQVDAPPSVSGTVLVSAGTLSGYEFGSTVLSPYQPFVHVKPVAVIDQGVFVFQGTFDTSIASSLGHVTRAMALQTSANLDGALSEAQQAVAVNSHVLQAQMILGDTLASLHRWQDSEEAYERALAIAQTMEPVAKSDWTVTIHTKLSDLMAKAGKESR